MAAEIDPFLANTPFLNEGKVSENKRDHHKHKNVKRHTVIVYIHMRDDTFLPLFAPVHILDDPSSIHPVAQVFNGWYIS